MQLNYIYKNVYFMNSFIYFETDVVPVYFSSRTVKFKMYSKYDELIDKSKFLLTSDRSNINLIIIYDASIKEDGYDLEIDKRNIVIKVRNERGIRYAFRVLNDLVVNQNGKAKLPLIKINDEPSFKYRGIIEGYYGIPWSYESRKDLPIFMDEYRLNTYMYAPKSDPYHRVKWAELYPEEEFKKLIEFKESLEVKHIDFYYCISPGYTKGDYIFDYTNEKAFELLFRKLDQVISEGVNKFGLLLDDIDYVLTGDNLKKFKRPGIAHAYICNRVYDYLKDRVVDLEFVMCPTEYHQIGESLYRDDLKRLLNDEIKVFWTGDNVCAEVITDEQVRVTKEAFGRDLFIWDNFPVTDFTYGVRQYIGPIINRTVSLSNYANGYIINPMNLYEISKLSMITQSHYAWNSAKYDPNRSFEIALKSLGSEFFEASKEYIKYNLPSVLTHGFLDEERRILENNEAILNYLEGVSKSAKKILKLDLPIIEELKPWLERTIEEEKIVKKILSNTYKKAEVLEFLEDDKFSGSELFDNLIKKYNILTDEEFEALIKKRRGGQWYRIWEERK